MGGPVPVMQSASGSGQHYGTVDLRTDHGTFKMGATGDTMNQLNQAAVDKRIRQGVPKPSHYR